MSGRTPKKLETAAITNGVDVLFFKKKLGNSISYYKWHIETSYVVAVHKHRNAINMMALSTFSTSVLVSGFEPKKVMWSDKEERIVTFTTEKIFEHHRSAVLKVLQ